MKLAVLNVENTLKCCDCKYSDNIVLVNSVNVEENFIVLTKFSS